MINDEGGPIPICRTFPFVPDNNEGIEVINPKTGEKVRVKAGPLVIKENNGSVLGKGIIFDEPTCWPASDSLIGLMVCDMCKDHGDRDDGEYCKAANIKLEPRNSPCQRFIKPEDYTEDRRSFSAPEIIRDSLIVDWILDNYPTELCYATDNNGEGSYYVFNGKHMEIDTLMSSRKFVESKVKDLYNAYVIQLKSTEQYMTIQDKDGSDKEVYTPEYKAALKHLKDAEKYLDVRHQKDLWELLKTRLTRKVKEFNTNKNLLCLNNGVYDLSKHELLPHNAAFNISLMAPVDYDSNAKCPKFQELLEYQFETPEERRYIRYIFGGSLLRIVRKDASNVYFFGIPDTGKSTLLLAVIKTLGDPSGYGITRSPDYNTIRAAKRETRNDRLQTRNKCLIGIDETRKDEKQDTESIKNSSGGASTNVRGLYQADETLEPTATTINTCNELPPFEFDDEALVNRLLLVKFEKKLSNPKKDRPYYEELVSTEASGILNWLLDGVKDYQQNGAPPMPEKFEQTKKEIVGDSDKVAKFIRKYCVTGDHLKCRMTWTGFNMNLETYLTNVERQDKKFHPGRKKILTTLQRFGVKLEDSKPVKVNGTTARNVLLGIREKTPVEISREEDQAWKEESEQLHQELPPEIISFIDKQQYKTADDDQIALAVKVPVRYLSPVLEAMVKRGELLRDGPRGYTLPFAPKPV